MRQFLGWASLASALALGGCSGANSSVRYGPDGQQEYFVDCSGKPMTRCYGRALQLCPQGYFLVQDSQVPGGSHSGGIFGHTKHVSGESRDTEITWKNQLIVRCKPAAAAAGPDAPAH